MHWQHMTASLLGSWASATLWRPRLSFGSGRKLDLKPLSQAGAPRRAPAAGRASVRRLPASAACWRPWASRCAPAPQAAAPARGLASPGAPWARRTQRRRRQTRPRACSLVTAGRRCRRPCGAPGARAMKSRVSLNRLACYLSRPLHPSERGGQAWTCLPRNA